MAFDPSGLWLREDCSREDFVFGDSQNRAYDLLKGVLSEPLRPIIQFYLLALDDGGFYGRRYRLDRVDHNNAMEFRGGNSEDPNRHVFTLEPRNRRRGSSRAHLIGYVDSNYLNTIRVGILHGINYEKMNILLQEINLEKFVNNIDAFCNDAARNDHESFYEPIIDEIRK